MTISEIYSTAYRFASEHARKHARMTPDASDLELAVLMLRKLYPHVTAH